MGKERFEFGENWREFLENLTDERIKESEKSLQEWLNTQILDGKTFLDIGSGGYPFEVAKPEDIFDFFHNKGFSLEKLYTAGGGHACNQYVFRKA